MAEQFLAGKVAIVTGANTGIGKAIAEELAKRGAKVVINYRSHPERTEEMITAIKAAGGEAIGAQADVTQLDQLQQVVDTAVTSYGRLDVMVNNAGLETRTSVLDTTPEDYDRVLDVNLKSAFFGTQFAAKQMIKQGGGGRIINISSVHEDWPMPNNTAYCLSKGGVRMLTRTAGVELAPHGITMVNIGPGAVDTQSTPPMPVIRRCSTSSMPPFPWAAWLNPRRLPLWRPLWPVMGPATSQPPASLLTAASCRAAPGSELLSGSPQRGVIPQLLQHTLIELLLRRELR